MTRKLPEGVVGVSAGALAGIVLSILPLEGWFLLVPAAGIGLLIKSAAVGRDIRRFPLAYGTAAVSLAAVIALAF